MLHLRHGAKPPYIINKLGEFLRSNGKVSKEWEQEMVTYLAKHNPNPFKLKQAAVVRSSCPCGIMQAERNALEESANLLRCSFYHYVGTTDLDIAHWTLLASWYVPPCTYFQCLRILVLLVRRKRVPVSPGSITCLLMELCK